MLVHIDAKWECFNRLSAGMMHLQSKNVGSKTAAAVSTVSNPYLRPAISTAFAIVSHGFNGTHHFGRDYFDTLNKLGYAVYTFDFPAEALAARATTIP